MDSYEVGEDESSGSFTVSTLQGSSCQSSGQRDIMINALMPGVLVLMTVKVFDDKLSDGERGDLEGYRLLNHHLRLSRLRLL